MKNKTNYNYREYRKHKPTKPSYFDQAQESGFPSPAILESYEEIHPGTFKKLMEMSDLEQKHRHAMEQKQVRAAICTTRLGQMLSAIMALAFLYTGFILFQKYNATLFASVVIISGFAFLYLLHKKAHKPKGHFEQNKKYSRSYPPRRPA